MKKFFATLLLTLSITTAWAESNRVEEHLDRAQMLYKAENYASAMAELRMADRAFDSQTTDHQHARAAYLLACVQCRIEPSTAQAAAVEFLQRYPYTQYTNQVRFILGSALYAKAEQREAIEQWLNVRSEGLDDQDQEAMLFKMGHSYMELGDYPRALSNLKRVSRGNIWSDPARYYIAYINYVDGNYTAAKGEFVALSASPQYAKIVPYYLLHIEFLEGNYRYVTENGDALIASSNRSRAGEIAKMVAQSWFALDDFGRALDYMDAFAKMGGTTTRNDDYLIGYSLYMTHNYSGAAQSLVRSCGPDDAMSQSASYVLGDCYLRLGDKSAALSSFSIASAGAFDTTVAQDALLNYCKLQYELGGGVFNEAINAMNRYLLLYPKSTKTAQVREFLASALYNSRNYKAAYNTIIELPNPDNNIRIARQKIEYFRALELMNEDKLGEATKMLLSAERLACSPKFTALSKFWQGEILYKQERYNEALKQYLAYYRLAPEGEHERIMASYSMGYCYFNTGRLSDSRDWFNDFISFYKTPDGYRADAYNRLGDVLYNEREFWRAADMYQKALSLETEHRHYATYRRAFMWGLVDRTPQKIEALRSIIAKNEGTYVDAATYELGRTLMTLERFDEASQMLKQYVERYPNSKDYIRALSDLGLISQNLGRRNEALAYYKRVVERAPSGSSAKDALEGIRSIYVDINDVDSYFNFAKGAGVELSEGAAERDSLSFVSAQRVYMSGDNSKAAAAMKGYLSRYPAGNFKNNALYMLGSSQLKSGDRAGAIGTFETFTTLYTNDYTERSLSELAQIYATDKRWDDVQRVELLVARSASKNDDVQRALESYLTSTMRTGDNTKILSAVDVITQEFATHEPIANQALFARAQIVGGSEASDIFRKLSADPSTPHGAQSAYRHAQELHASGKSDQAQKAIVAMGKSNTTQSYWLGMAYILLGDIYLSRGDKFQARATFQSVADGYSPADDGIVEQARDRIKNLK